MTITTGQLSAISLTYANSAAWAGFDSTTRASAGNLQANWDRIVSAVTGQYKTVLDSAVHEINLIEGTAGADYIGISGVTGIGTGSTVYSAIYSLSTSVSAINVSAAYAGSAAYAVSASTAANATTAATAAAATTAITANSAITVGLLSGLLTTASSDIVTAINEVTTSFSSHLADSAKFVTNYGAVGDGITDDTAAIAAAIAACENGDTLYFPKGTYLITSTITVSKVLYIRGSSFYNTIIKKTGSGNAIILNAAYIKMFDITINSDGTSTVGIEIAKNNIDLIRVKSSSHGSHGIKIDVDCWIINIDMCDVYNNGGNGIYMVSTGISDQINNVNITNSSIHSNAVHGIYLNGTAINILHNNIEQNVNAGVFISTNTNNCYMVNIKNNYFEINKSGMVKMDLYPSTGKNLYTLNIEGNYMTMTAAQADIGLTALINAETDTDGQGLISCRIKNNFMTTDSLYYVDLDKACYRWSEHDFQGDNMFALDSYASKFRDLGEAAVNPYIKALGIQGYFFAKGVTYTATNKSDNVISGLPTAQYPILLSGGRYFHKIGVYIETDSTSYTVTFTLLKRNAKTGEAFASIVAESKSTNNGSKYVESSRLASLVDTELVRISPYEDWYLQLTFANIGGGTTFSIHDPILYYI